MPSVRHSCSKESELEVEAKQGNCATCDGKEKAPVEEPKRLAKKQGRKLVVLISSLSEHVEE